MSGSRSMAMMVVAVTSAIAIEPHEAAAQPALTEPWPHEEPVSDIQQIGGTLTALVIGFGLGHAVEGRWAAEGWKFTVIDSVAMTGLIAGSATISSCETHCEAFGIALYASLLVTAASRYFQIYDAAWGARRHNRRIEARRQRAGTMHGTTAQPGPRPARLTVVPVLAPTAAADGVVAGAALQF